MPPNLTPRPSFAPAKDTKAFWREKMADKIDHDVIIRYCEKKKCLIAEKKC
jgi:hypothetical protein